jgi:hypothetical protein
MTVETGVPGGAVNRSAKPRDASRTGRRSAHGCHCPPCSQERGPWRCTDDSILVTTIKGGGGPRLRDGVGNVRLDR